MCVHNKDVSFLRLLGTLITIIYAPYSKVRGAFISELSPFLSDKKKHLIACKKQRSGKLMDCCL